MRTSAQGIEFLERHEGVVLKAYRDPVGIWTIGAGLTKASGVVAPKAGMQLTAKQAKKLLGAALGRNYEPTVLVEMPGAAQHEFDGGISFHWNTGAIGRASWVRSWLAKNTKGVRDNLAKWRKGGGRVLPGLVRRRHEEANLILLADYGSTRTGVPRASGEAKLIAPMHPGLVPEVRAALTALGFDPGSNAGQISEQAVREFQRRQDLTVDGKIGRATLSTIQRRLDAAKKAKAGAAGAGAGAAGTVAPGVAPDLAGLEWLGWAALALGAAYLLWTAFTYRDAIAAKITDRAPRFAAKLRSF